MSDRAPDALGLPESAPTVALLPWGNVYEDFFERSGLTLDTFLSDFRGSYMFGYVDALRIAGVRTAIVVVSRDVNEVRRAVHEPTGAPVIMLPAPRSYRLISKRMRNPYGATVEETFGEVEGLRRLAQPVLGVARDLAPYLATPVRLLASELRRETCDAILCQEYEYPRFDICTLVSRLTGIRLVAVFQGGDAQRWRPERFVRPRSIRACRKLIIGPQAEMDRVRDRYGVAPGKIAQIFNPVDPEVWSPGDGRAARELLGIPAEARVAVWHGRLEIGKKGLDILLDCWRLVRKARGAEDSWLLLIGGGPSEFEVRQRMDTSDAGNVTFVSELIHDVRTIRAYLTAGDVYVFPSRFEGFAVAPVEAMACGLPVVATDVAGVKEAVGIGAESAGAIVPVEDARALADQLTRFLADPELCCTAGKRARARVLASFGLESVGRQLRDVLIVTGSAASAGSPR